MYRYKKLTSGLQTKELEAYLDVDVEDENENEKVCSICGKRHFLSLEKVNWHQIAVYHCDKGANFRDTYEFFDVCSFGCYLKQIKKAADKLECSKTGRIDGMDLNFIRKLLFFYSSYFQ